MKKITHLFIGACTLTFISNTFCMLTKTSLSRAITTHKKMRSFHATPSACYIDPLGISACIVAIWNSYDIINNQTLLEGKIKRLEEAIKQNEERYTLALKASQQNKEH